MSSKKEDNNDSNLSSEEEEEEEEDDELSNFNLSMISVAGPSKHKCGYCKQKDTSVSFGIWAHSMTCTVKSLSLMFN
jgi:arginine-tRNA-protein transferase